MSLNIENTKKILITTDGSDYSVRAAELGISIAKLLNSEITVIYVIDTIVLDQISKAQRGTVEKEFQEDGHRYVNYIVNLAEKQGVKATAIVTKGQPFEVIVKTAKSLGMNLIVMGTYGRRGTERILLGSVTERVLEYATCPLLVVK